MSLTMCRPTVDCLRKISMARRSQYVGIMRLLLLFLCVLPAPLLAQFQYTTSNGAITITSYTGYGGSVIIPSQINGLPVKSIGSGAFASCAIVHDVTIPSSVTSIGNNAFQNCSNLYTVTFGSNITSIGNYAFASCTHLGSATLPNGVTSIGNYAFYSCNYMTKATLPDGITSIGSHAFTNCAYLS